MLLGLYRIRYTLHLGTGEVYKDKVNDILKLKTEHWIAKSIYIIESIPLQSQVPEKPRSQH